MTYTAPNTVAASDAITAANHNTYIRDNLRALAKYADGDIAHAFGRTSAPTVGSDQTFATIDALSLDWGRITTWATSLSQTLQIRFWTAMNVTALGGATGITVTQKVFCYGSQNATGRVGTYLSLRTWSPTATVAWKTEDSGWLTASGLTTNLTTDGFASYAPAFNIAGTGGTPTIADLTMHIYLRFA